MLRGLAQVHASAQGLQLITFDADGTLYADGCHMQVSSPENDDVRHQLRLQQ